MTEQTKLLIEIQELGYNIVTCGECGVVNIIEIREQEDDHTCFDCGFQSDGCDFPDLFY